MLTPVASFTLDGLTPCRVAVEVDVRPGLPAFTIVGLGDRAVREARERVKAAIQNAGWAFPQQRITVNLAPADLPKEGPSFDLAIACGILRATGVIRPDALDAVAVFGELGLNGDLRPCRGALAAAEGAAREGIGSILVPAAQLGEAARAGGIGVAGVLDLREAVAVLAGESAGQPAPAPVAPVRRRGPDLCEVRGHAAAIRALTVAAAGAHHVLLIGPPGTGKSMLARRLPGLLPPLEEREALEVLRIRSVTGVGVADGEARPFRAPHHTISAAGLVGGGALPMPGEVTLAHHGVLFLDELAEFARPALEALRQPLEDGALTIVRGQRVTRFPAVVQLVAATNPCPCGHHGTHRCRCGPDEVDRYARRISGPLRDRLDLVCELTAPTEAELAGPPVTGSAAAREAVAGARARQRDRAEAGAPVWNAQLSPAAVRALARTAEADAVLRRAYRHGLVSMRGHDRVLRVARTIADLGDREQITADDVREALSQRVPVPAPERQAVG